MEDYEQLAFKRGFEQMRSRMKEALDAEKVKLIMRDSEEPISPYGVIDRMISFCNESHPTVE